MQSLQSIHNSGIGKVDADRRLGVFVLMLAGLLFLPGCQVLSLETLRGEPALIGQTKREADIACRDCHRDVVDRYLSTAHYRTSFEASLQTVSGPIEDGRNILRTRDPLTHFRIIQEDGQLFQVAEWMEKGRRKERKEPIDLVVGSGRKGQSYLFWKDGFLFQLPVSYLVEGDQWINSPGFEDGKVNFGRGIPPRCLECHATHFLLEFEDNQPRYNRDYMTGIGCGRCHGRANRHVSYHRANPNDRQGRFIVNPARLSRTRELESCAVCHSGDREVKKSTFAYTPGDNLSEFLAPDTGPQPYPDVHGNQVALLSHSACFQESDVMTCTTCHDVHQTERDLAAMSEKCLACHTEEHSTLESRHLGRLQDNCIDCHMPLRESRVLTIHLPDRVYAPPYRDHRIAVYPETKR